jgi:hypothetical protein
MTFAMLNKLVATSARDMDQQVRPDVKGLPFVPTFLLRADNARALICIQCERHKLSSTGRAHLLTVERSCTKHLIIRFVVS